VIKKDSAQTC